MKRKDHNSGHNSQHSTIIPPTQSTNTSAKKSTVNDNDDLDALLEAINDETLQNPPPKIAKLFFEDNPFTNISTDNANELVSSELVKDASIDSSDSEVVERRCPSSPTGFDIASQNIIPQPAQPISNNLPHPIPLQSDEISIHLIDKNTRAICGNVQTWSVCPQDYIKVPQSLVFITKYEMVGAMYKLGLLDASNILFEGTAQAHVFSRVKPHYGMALLISDFTLLFNFSSLPHAIITVRNVSSLHANIHPVDDD